MRVLERQRIDRVSWWCGVELFALAIRASQHRVHELARAHSMAALRQLNGLRNRGVGRHTSHVQELIDAEPEEIDHIGIQARQSTAHTLRENRVDRRAIAQHSVDELARPAAVARIERTDTTLERLVEELSAPEVDADLRGYRPRGGYPTDSCNGRVHEPSIPVVGEEGTATSRRGILPARYACLPASTAPFIAAAMRIGSCAAAIPVFMRIPSTPCSITTQASDAVPTPASTITGTESRCLMVRIA